MGAASDYLELKLLDHLLKNTSYTSPTAIYIGLSSADPTDSASNECKAVGVDNYGRKQVIFATASAGSAVGPTATTTFNQCTGNSWGTIHGYCIFDHSSATNSSNYLLYGTLSSDVTCNVNDTVEFATSSITISLD